MSGRGHRRCAWLVTVLALATAWTVTVPARAAEGVKDYRRMFIQGRLSDPGSGGAMVGATVTLEGEDGRHQALTDDQGVFTFERLPVAPYDLRIETADGRALRSGRGLEVTGPTRSRVRLSFGRGEGTRLHVEPDERDRIVLSVPSPPPAWGRFGKQGAIFAAVALVLLAL